MVHVLCCGPLDAGSRSRVTRAEQREKNHLPWPAAFGAAQDAVGCDSTLMSHAEFFLYEHLQVLLPRDSLNPLLAQSVLVLSQVQDLALGLAELCEVPTQACQGLFGWHPFPPVCQHHTASCCQSHCPYHQQKCKNYQSQYWPLRSTTHGNPCNCFKSKWWKHIYGTYAEKNFLRPFSLLLSNSSNFRLNYGQMITTDSSVFVLDSYFRSLINTKTYIWSVEPCLQWMQTYFKKQEAKRQ